MFSSPRIRFVSSEAVEGQEVSMVQPKAIAL
jgi:hypothetical protein